MNQSVGFKQRVLILKHVVVHQAGRIYLIKCVIQCFRNSTDLTRLDLKIQILIYQLIISLYPIFKQELPVQPLLHTSTHTHTLALQCNLLFLSFFLSNTRHLLPFHPLGMCAPCLVMRAPVINGRSASTLTLAQENALSSGMEAATAMLITLCPWKRVRESVGT